MGILASHKKLVVILEAISQLKFHGRYSESRQGVCLLLTLNLQFQIMKSGCMLYTAALYSLTGWILTACLIKNDTFFVTARSTSATTTTILKRMMVGCNYSQLLSEPTPMSE